MKTLLRSTFMVSPADCPELLLQNFHLLEDDHFVFFNGVDAILWAAIRDFSHMPQQCSPYFEELEQHFQSTKEFRCLDRLNELRNVDAVYRGDFVTHLEKLQQVGRTLELRKLLQETDEIALKGKEVKQGEITITLRGPIDAVRHFLDKSYAIVTPTSRG